MKKIKRTTYAANPTAPQKTINNPVAKHCRIFNKSVIIPNPRKEYVRNPKHKNGYIDHD